MKAEALDLHSFGQGLLETEDLDPIYTMLWRAGLPAGLLSRWCLAYWCFYHAGVASRIAEAHDFYAAMQRAHDEKWPRGTERRHFRGRTSATAVAFLRSRYSEPTDAVHAVTRPTFREVSEAVRAWPGFGPWIAFKVADMLERVLAAPVSFEDSVLAIYEEPAAGARLYSPHETLESVVALLCADFAMYKAPPRFDRPVGVQEVETILCKWKSHVGGHYEIGKDTREVRHALHGWGDLAHSLAAHLPS